MDKETKAYIDEQFTKQKKDQENSMLLAQDSFAKRKKQVKHIVLICACIMGVLVVAELFLLFWFQLRAYI